MVHSDDNGFVLPPKISPIHIVVLPIIHSEEIKHDILKFCENLKKEVEGIKYFSSNITLEIDSSDMRGGEKKWKWIKNGVPLIVEIGPKEIENKELFVQRRDTLEKKSYKKDLFLYSVVEILDNIQKTLFDKAKNFLHENIKKVDDKGEFYTFFSQNEKEDFGMENGFIKAYFCQDEKEEELIKKELSVSLRVIPFDQQNKEGSCIFCKKKCKTEAVFAKAY